MMIMMMRMVLVCMSYRATSMATAIPAPRESASLSSYFDAAVVTPAKAKKKVCMYVCMYVCM